MRLPLSFTLLLAAAFCCAAPAWRAGAAGDPPAGRRAALVNGALITADAFEHEVQRVERLNLRGKRPAAANKKQVLENLILRELLYQEARRAGTRVPQGEVAAKLAELTGKLHGQEALESTLDRLGLSAPDLERQLAQGMVIDQFLAGRFSQAPSDDEVSSYYQEHQDEFREALRLRLSHILVKIDPAGDPARKEQGRARLLALARRVSAGEDFAALAREASECSSAQSGGDLGYFLPGQLAREMEDEARFLKPGEVSGVVEDRFGLHLLQLTELRPAALLPLDQVKGKITARLREQKQMKALAPLLKRLRAAAKVEILLNENE